MDPHSPYRWELPSWKLYIYLVSLFMRTPSLWWELHSLKPPHHLSNPLMKKQTFDKPFENKPCYYNSTHHLQYEVPLLSPLRPSPVWSIPTVTAPTISGMKYRSCHRSDHLRYEVSLLSLLRPSPVWSIPTVTAPTISGMKYPSCHCSDHLQMKYFCCHRSHHFFCISAMNTILYN